MWGATAVNTTFTIALTIVAISMCTVLYQQAKDTHIWRHAPHVRHSVCVLESGLGFVFTSDAQRDHS
jgi:hypothetical protein